jgi:hypothetical protein
MFRKVAAILIMIVLALPVSVSAQDADSAERLTYGDTITRTFEADGGDFNFNFYAIKGDILTLTMTARRADELDPALQLIAPDGKLIAQNDDSLDARFGVTNARLANFPIPETGLYMIRAAREKGTKGQFTVAIKANRAGESRATIETPGTASGRLSATTPTITYEFRAAAGAVLNIQVKADNTTRFNPIIALLDPADKEINRSVVNKNAPTIANLSRVVIKTDGVYSIVVQAEKTTGKFAIEIKTEAKSEPIAFDEPLDEAISSTETEQRYMFEGKAGDVVTITMAAKSGTLDTSLKLLTVEGKQIANNENVGSGVTGLKRSDARINKFKLPADGVYIIVASRAPSSRTTGTYTLTLTRE